MMLADNAVTTNIESTPKMFYVNTMEIDNKIFLERWGYSNYTV